MSRAFALTMKRPQETLGIPMSMGRRLSAAGKVSWFSLIVIATCVCMGVYMFQINTAAKQGYTLRALQKRLESLNERVTALDNQTAQMQTIRTVEERIKGLGYVPADHMEFMDPNHGYALAR
jgi:TolA-binding protein